MKKLIALVLISSFVFTGCSQVFNSDKITETRNDVVTETSSEDEEVLLSEDEDDTITITENNYIELVNEVDYDSFSSLQDSDLLNYVAGNVYANLENELGDDYIVENVSTRYLSDEYITEMEYNSLENVYFGYTLSEIQAEFGDSTYVYTIGDNGETVIEIVGPRDTSFNQIVRNVSIGTGVIIVCITVSTVTTGPISIMFATAAEYAIDYAMHSAIIAGVTKGLITSIETGDVSQTIRESAVAASEGFMIGAIGGAIYGALGEGAYSIFEDIVSSAGSDRPTPQESELYALNGYYPGGTFQATYLNGEEVPYGTAGASRPDIVFENVAVEVKNYDLQANISDLVSTLRSQIMQRNQNLPSSMTQEIFLDARGQGLSLEQMIEIVDFLQRALSDVYPDIPIQYAY